MWRSGIAKEEHKKARSLLYLGFSLDRMGFMGLGTKNVKNMKFELLVPPAKNLKIKIWPLKMFKKTTHNYIPINGLSELL